MAAGPMGVDECRRLFADAAVEQLSGLIRRYRKDERSGVQTAVEAARKRLKAYQAEERRLDGLSELEASLREQGFAAVAGVDEVGRGALAGPLTAGAVIFGPGVRIAGLNDSKLLTPEQRETLAVEIKRTAISWSVAHVPSTDLDSLGMTAALKRAMLAAIAGLTPAPDHVVIDGTPLHLGMSETSVVKGDSKVAAIAAASIVAKVTRDALMRDFESVYPGYDFAGNKGYGTTDHQAAIGRLGLCDIHRRSFSPCGGTLQLF
ncbi:MAG: ribonuclease HII [Coriobacteriia bacterium]